MKILENFKVFFWDFDGVIKESINIKSQSYYRLFEPYGIKIAQKILDHHKSNNGISRFDKVPIYLRWAGLDTSKSTVIKFCDEFSKLVLNAVINSPWVPGAEEYLRANKYNQIFICVSATPQEELEYIINELNLTNCFFRVFGSPHSKKNVINNLCSELNLDKTKCLMIGDAHSDLEAAKVNEINFILRRHSDNRNLWNSCAENFIEDFLI
jgi:phosphoglycolate phosphatase-like HAD superfamily hydrolase